MSQYKSKAIGPKEERARIGTPAGEPPAKGRQRHGTECLTDVCPEHAETEARRVLDAEYLEEEGLEGEEVSTSGGITGTHVTGGVPAGGAQSVGTRPNPRHTTAECRTESQPGRTSV